MNRTQTLSAIAILGLAIAISGGLYWTNLRIARQQPLGKDFAVYWGAARSLLQFETDPYGTLASLNAQQAVGQPNPDAAAPGFRLDLPLYAEMFAFLLAGISDFRIALALWMLLLELALVATALLSNSLLGAGQRISFYALVLFGLFWVQAIWPLREGNAVILAGLFVVAGMVALHSAHEEAAGVLLALGSFKFLTLGPFLIFIILWSLYRRRWRLPFAYFMSLGILVAVSYFFFAGWFIPYLRAIIINLRSSDLISTGKLFSASFPGFGARLSQIVTATTAALILWEWWSARNHDYRQMVWAAGATLCLTPFLGLPTNSQDYAVLILPIALFTLLVGERWGNKGRIIALAFLLALFGGLWFLFLSSSKPQLAMYFPAPLAVLLALYWIRWWAIRPPRTWIDSIYKPT